jgi:hypothetical protein
MLTTVPPPQDADYEDLLGLWSDLEAGLATLLLRPGQIPDFTAKVRQYDRWMCDLLRQDTDIGLYLLFQLASDRALGYSSAHALICAVLCHVLSHDLALPAAERDSLVGAAMTMNVAMTALQNELAEQNDKPGSAQQRGIRTHAERGRQLLADVGVADALWLDVVSIHHDQQPGTRALADLPALHRLGRILHVVDRYAAMISPRKTRGGRSATETVRSMMTQADGLRDQVAYALVRAVGLCPPGTYVQMDSGEIAVVLRRSATANQPMVAAVMGRSGDKLSAPRLHRTAFGGPAIQSAMTHDMVRNRVRINHQNLLRLGLQAVRQHGPG